LVMAPILRSVMVVCRLREKGLACLMTARFRAVAGGYFGLLELYTFWMLVPADWSVR